MTGATEPLVSVILPTHNRADLLRRAMASVLGQTWRNLELVVVDDASTDDTAGTVASFADSRVRYLRLPENRRAAAARNAGLSIATGDLVAFQDDDDQWLIDKLRQQVASLKAAPGAGLCLCSHLWVGESVTRLVGDADAFARLDFRRGPLGGFGVIATPGWLARRSVLEKAGGFDERLRVWDDWELGLRMSRLAPFTHVDEPLFLHDRIQGGGMWNAQKNYSHDMRIILDKHGGIWLGAPRLLARMQLLVARSEAQFHSPREGRSWALRALRLDPCEPRTWVLLAGTYAGSQAVNAGVGFWHKVQGLIGRGRR